MVYIIYTRVWYICLYSPLYCERRNIRSTSFYLRCTENCVLQTFAYTKALCQGRHVICTETKSQYGTVLKTVKWANDVFGNNNFTLFYLSGRHIMAFTDNNGTPTTSHCPLPDV